jgi:cation transport regulator ChaC
MSRPAPVAVSCSSDWTQEERKGRCRRVSGECGYSATVRSCGTVGSWMWGERASTARSSLAIAGPSTRNPFRTGDRQTRQVRRWGLEPGDGSCVGTAFEFPDAERAAIEAQLRGREGASFSLVELQVRLPDGRDVNALTPVNDRQHRTYIGGVPLDRRAAMARTAKGTSGACSNYVRNIHQKLIDLRINDPDVDAFIALVERPIAE